MTRDEIETHRRVLKTYFSNKGEARAVFNTICDMAVKSLKTPAPEGDAMQEARRLLARSLAAIRLGEMDFITEICAFLERSEPQRVLPKEE